MKSLNLMRVLGVLGLAVALPAAADWGRDQITVHCKSSGYGYNECRVPGRVVEIRGYNTRSRSECIPNRTFGARGDRIWVDQGCEANFDVIVDRGGYGRPGPGWGRPGHGGRPGPRWPR